ncbi:MAG: ribosome maturation factor RimP [Cellulomonadaceae bacterium]
MASQTTTTRAIEDAIAPRVAAAGLFCEQVNVGGPAHRMVVRVTVDLPEDEVGSLDLDRLAEVSREVSQALDDVDVVRGAYQLEVTTPGTSRPLTERRHFLRARTRRVRLELRSGGAVTGRLAEVTGDVLRVEDEDSTVEVTLGDVTRGTIEVELARLADETGTDEED